VDFHPAVGTELAFEDFVVDAVVEDFGTAAGMEPRPASRRAMRTSRVESLAIFVKWLISMAV